MVNKRCNAWFATALLFIAAASCSRPQPAYTPEHARLSRLGLSYALYAGEHRGRPPESIEELRRYVQETTKPEQLERLGVSSIDELFISQRDGRSYRMVRLPPLPAPKGAQPPPVVLYEQIGHEGKRLVAYLGGGAEEVDADKFQQLVPDAQ